MALDPEGDSLSFTINARPAWMTFDTQTGKLSGTPLANDIGSYQLVITVSDGVDQTSTPPFSLKVLSTADPAHQLTLTAVVPHRVKVGEGFRIVPVATSSAGTLRFTALNLPEWASFDNQTGVIEGTPQSADVGVYDNIRLFVTGDQQTVSLAPFSVEVYSDAVELPKFSVNGVFPTSVETGTHFSFVPELKNTPMEKVVFSVANLPVALEFDPETGAVCGTFKEYQHGPYHNITFTAQEGDQIVVLGPFELLVTTPDKKIRLDISENNISGYQETRILPSEDNVAFNIDFDSYGLGYGEEISTIEIYSRTAGKYTRYDCHNNKQVLNLALDAIPELRQGLTGVVVMTQDYFCDSIYKDKPLSLTHLETQNAYPVQTHKNGRFVVDDLPLGSFNLCILEESMWMGPLCRIVTNNIGTDYVEFLQQSPEPADAPNIYLYPEIEGKVSVRLELPDNSTIIKAIPDYSEGWSVNVMPEGKVDGQYDYLFYETSLFIEKKATTGWIVQGGDLANEFTQILKAYGFVGREIEDFNQFWVPFYSSAERTAAWFAVYPQDAERMSRLVISPKPDTLMRMLLKIRPLNKPISLQAPKIVPVVRNGFTVVEWGVLNEPHH